MEKCFCHLVDSETGERYVVKDAEARKKIEALENAELGEIDDLKNRTSSLEGRVNSLSSGLSNQGNINTDQESKIAALQTKTASLETKLANEKTARETQDINLGNSNTNRKNEITALQTRMTNVENVNATQSTNIETALNNASSNTTRIGNLEGTVATHSTKIGTLEGQNTTRQNEITALTTRVGAAEGQIATLQPANITTIENRVTALEGKTIDALYHHSVILKANIYRTNDKDFTTVLGKIIIPIEYTTTDATHSAGTLGNKIFGLTMPSTDVTRNGLIMTSLQDGTSAIFSQFVLRPQGEDIWITLKGETIEYNYLLSVYWEGFSEYSTVTKVY